MNHVLSDEDARTYLEIGITAQEAVKLRWPDLSDSDVEYVLWELTPFPMVSGIHDVVDAIAEVDVKFEQQIIAGTTRPDGDLE